MHYIPNLTMSQYISCTNCNTNIYKNGKILFLNNLFDNQN